MQQFCSRHRQRGATALGMLAIIAVLGFGLYGAIRLTPVYIEYYEIVRTMESIASENSAASTSIDKLRFALNRRWLIEDISSIPYTDVEIRRIGGGFEMTADYRAEVPFIANVSLVADFNKTVSVE
jgi:hypothetical protein